MKSCRPYTEQSRQAIGTDGLRCLFLDHNDHFDRVQGIIPIISWHRDDFIQHFNTTVDFAEYRIASIESARVRHANEKLRAAVVEIARAVAFARHLGHGNGAAFMRLIIRFGRQAVPRPSRPVQFSRGSFACRVAPLNHETGNDAVETDAVIEPNFCEIDEIFHVPRRRIRISLTSISPNFVEITTRGFFFSNCMAIVKFSSMERRFARKSDRRLDASEKASGPPIS